MLDRGVEYCMEKSMEKFGNRVYIMETGGIKEVYDSLYNKVSLSRQNKIDKYMQKKDKNLSLAAGLLLKQALADLGINSYNIEYGENGKPYLKNERIFYNLSHSEERAMCVVSMEEVGCDTEKIADIDFKIADRFFNPSECELLNDLSDINEKRTMFFRLWTLKESFMKATGLGMELPLDSFSVDITDDIISVRQNISKERYYFKEYDRNDGYRFAVCSLAPDFENEIRIINPDALK